MALAADSAVTISVGDKTKVYDTAEKLFEFSRTQPIAIMIYNNVEFVGVPLDVLIRKFRNETANKKSYKYIKDASDDFLKYLGTFDHDVIEEKRYLFSVINESFKKIDRVHEAKLRSALREFTKSKGSTELPDPEPLLTELIKEESRVQKAKNLKGYLSNVTMAQFSARFGDVIRKASKAVFKQFCNEDVVSAAITLGFRLMKSAESSSLLTGLVFGGFAEADMFPTLRYLEIDGVFFGKIKVLSVSEIDIDRMKTRAAVVPFAQKEMVERFMFGLDSELEGEVEKFVETAFSELIDSFGKISVTVRNSYKKKIDEKFNEMMNELKDSSRHDLLDIVYFMSKKELADIAHALVEITSHKRRFSTEEQTVGGAIDVAILTKSEGLVWIKRKHYFGPDVNQAYLSRVLNPKGEGK